MSDNSQIYHKVTMSYADAEKYMKVGWKIASIQKVTLRGINKEYDEYILVWDKDGIPVMPT